MDCVDVEVIEEVVPTPEVDWLPYAAIAASIVLALLIARR